MIDWKDLTLDGIEEIKRLIKGEVEIPDGMTLEKYMEKWIKK